MGLGYMDSPTRSSTRQLLKSRTLNIALYTLVATILVGWSSGLLTGPDTFSKLEERTVVYQHSVENFQNVFGSRYGSSAAWWGARKRPSSASTTPFSTFTCFGDEQHAVDMIYARPFRFHVYADIPNSLYNDTVLRASKFWEPDHRSVLPTLFAVPKLTLTSRPATISLKRKLDLSTT